MPRIKLTDTGGFTTVGEGVELDISNKFTRSNEGCIYGWQYPKSGSQGGSAEIIIGASTSVGKTDSDAEDNDDRAHYDGSNVIDMRNFVSEGNIIKITVYVAIKDETGNPPGITIGLHASESPYHTYNATYLQANTIQPLDTAPPEFHRIEFISMLYDVSDLTGVQILGSTYETTPLNDPDFEANDTNLDIWDSVAKPYWHVAAETQSGESSSHFYNMKMTVETEFIGKRSD